MKRFYTVVSIESVDDGYHVFLDDRPVKTKAGSFLCAPNEDIATRIMQEWSNQGEEIVPDTMPFTQILNTKIDRVSRERDVMSASVLKYLDTDLLCYPAADPEGLAALQKEKWRPWINWFEKKFNCSLETTTSLAAVTHLEQAHEAVASYVDGLDDDHFTILQLVTSVSGSLILALALVHRDINADVLLDACYIEETFKDDLYDAEKYGADPLLERAQKAALQDFQAAQDYCLFL